MALSPRFGTDRRPALSVRPRCAARQVRRPHPADHRHLSPAATEYAAVGTLFCESRANVFGPGFLPHFDKLTVSTGHDQLGLSIRRQIRKRDKL